MDENSLLKIMHQQWRDKSEQEKESYRRRAYVINNTTGSLEGTETKKRRVKKLQSKIKTCMDQLNGLGAPSLWVAKIPGVGPKSYYSKKIKKNENQKKDNEEMNILFLSGGNSSSDSTDEALDETLVISSSSSSENEPDELIVNVEVKSESEAQVKSEPEVQVWSEPEVKPEPEDVVPTSVKQSPHTVITKRRYGPRWQKKFH
ncbi:uncharacterized protein LOC114575279 [Exaiptasia diaphana]|uniref:Uncharacterized protein n=1 Tax=Exaiptasia diaphana TaxID=2652724 RepID=A0A913YJR3_EXADI|nr:uncharacterized protein LOC114575279 [Exaiptasia diaphana]